MKTLATSLLVILAAPALFAAPGFFYNFDSDPINAAPAGASFEGLATGRVIKVVGDPYDPFADGTNRSLLFQKASSAPTTGIARAIWTLPAQGSGVVAFDSFTQVGVGAESSQFAIHFLQNNLVGVAVWWNNAGTLVIQDGATSLQVPNAVPINQAVSVSLNYSIVDQSYGILINDQAVLVGEQSSFVFQNLVGELGFDVLRLSISNSAKINAINYIDNLSFSTVPEPASAALLAGVCALGVMGAMRRRGGR